jgi:hypothetical protein
MPLLANFRVRVTQKLPHVSRTCEKRLTLAHRATHLSPRAGGSYLAFNKSVTWCVSTSTLYNSFMSEWVNSPGLRKTKSKMMLPCLISESVSASTPRRDALLGSQEKMYQFTRVIRKPLLSAWAR